MKVTCKVEGPKSATLTIHRVESTSTAAFEAIEKLNTEKLDAIWRVQCTFQDRRDGLTTSGWLYIETRKVIEYSFVYGGTEESLTPPTPTGGN